MVFNFTTAPRTVMGEGALKIAAPYFKSFGNKALIVTGKIITKTGLAAQVQTVLKEQGIDSVIYNDLPGEPTDLMIYAGVEVFKKEKCDFTVGLGGGTPLDSAKAIAAMAVLPGKLGEYKGKYVVFTETATDSKLLIKGDALLPKIAVVDYTYTVSSPASITLATGMDALTHAIESYTCIKHTPVTDLYCLDAIKRIFKYLPVAVKDGTDKVARENMSIAAYEAGVAINTSPTTIVHGMSRPIGAVFHVPHGISNAMLLVECLRAVLPGAYSRFAELAVLVGAAQDGEEHAVASEKFLEKLEEFTKSLNVPTLREYGLDLQKFAQKEEKMASDSVASGSPANCYKVLSKEEQIAVYEILRNK